ncbi:MAG: hypothetical protein M1415_02325 [Firmicutes bacterium]|jgi:hypothetical protein|nr:hypothetical protein [Bacillota bacterium]
MMRIFRRWHWVILALVIVTSATATVRSLVHHPSFKMHPQLPIPFVLSTAQILHTLGPWLAERSHVPVYLPSPYLQMVSHQTKLLDVGYATLPIARGFHVAFMFPGAAHSKREALQLPAAGMEYLGAIWGLSAPTRWKTLVPKLGWFRLIPPRSATILSTSTVSVLPHQTDLEQCWIDSSNTGSSPLCQATWHQDHWRLMVLNVVGYGISLATERTQTLGEARNQASTLSRHPLPGQYGQAVIPIGESFGASASAATYVLGHARYFIVAMGGQAPRWAEQMREIHP